ncbi:hypothetical protein B0I35DRAFT_414954 [Stachybotrys elegans]|uniref:Uncharacterized protein n=1 Tax=Stachybotrys elegans TaxID=80388 RepID=A0A8K0SHQ7_9HYPO|nr:hypothetical protein B0I35DRAFT_414954 [Stachybotrys elegans]
MCAYNAVNGVPSCANNYLMETILYGHWNWTESNNYITSNCKAVLNVSENHHYVETNAEGTAICFIRDMDNSYKSSSDIPRVWLQGLLPEDVVDRALRRTFKSLVWVRYFDRDAPNGLKAAQVPYRGTGRAELNYLQLLPHSTSLKIPAEASQINGEPDAQSPERHSPTHSQPYSSFKHIV